MSPAGFPPRVSYLMNWGAPNFLGLSHICLSTTWLFCHDSPQVSPLPEQMVNPHCANWWGSGRSSKHGTFAYWILKLKGFEKTTVFLLQCLLCLVLCLCIFSQPAGFYLIFVPAMNFIALTPLKTQPSAFLKHPLLVHCNNDLSLFPELSTSLDSLPPLYFSWSLFWVYLWLLEAHTLYCLIGAFWNGYPSTSFKRQSARLFKSSFTLSSLELWLTWCFSTPLGSATLTTHSHIGFHLSSFNRFNPRFLSFSPLLYSVICWLSEICLQYFLQDQLKRSIEFFKYLIFSLYN